MAKATESAPQVTTPQHQPSQPKRDTQENSKRRSTINLEGKRRALEQKLDAIGKSRKIERPPGQTVELSVLERRKQLQNYYDRRGDNWGTHWKQLQTEYDELSVSWDLCNHPNNSQFGRANT